jgi:hypothetical protein
MDQESFYQIDFIYGGVSTRLLDIGAIVPSGVSISVKQGERRYGSIGAEWIENTADGKADTTISWTMVKDHGSHAALHGFCLRHAAGFPSGKTGVLRVEVSGGEVWELETAVLTSSAPAPLVDSAGFETLTAYSCAGGAMAPVTALTLYAGIPWIWILQDWEDIATEWDEL